MKSTHRFLSFLTKRTIILCVSALLLVSVSLGATIAYLIAKTDSTEDSFGPSKVQISFKGYDNVTNTGDVPVYMRALAVANWISTEDEHTIAAEKPVALVDFYIDFNESGWFLASDGFYYRRKPLAPDEDIHLIATAYQINEKTGYEFRLELLTSGIQAEPVDAVEEAWPAVKTVMVDGIYELTNAENP